MIFNIALAIPVCISIFFCVRIIYSSSTKSYKIFCLLVQERRVIFQYILLGILFYIDNFYLGVSTAGIVFPICMTLYTSMDFIGGFFPRRLSIAVMAVGFIVLIFNIFNNTFLKTDCDERKLKWGIYGEEISYCTIIRLIYQTILSLLTSAFLATLTGRTDHLFFCNANIYRSTGTINRKTINANYVHSMSIEKSNSMREGSMNNDSRKAAAQKTKDDEETEMQDNIIEMATNKGIEIFRDKNDIFANENANDDKTHNNSKDPPAIVKSDDTSKQDIKWFENPLPKDDTNDNKNEQGVKKKTQKRPTMVGRLSQWFVSNQKTDIWDEQRLNKLHGFIVILLVIMYTCHIIASPFTKLIENNNTIVIINIVEVICLIIGISSLVKMFFVNGSLTATKMIFDKGNVRTYIYIFWIIRSFIIEFLKGQLVYSFVVVYHSIVLYSSDMWYICNRKYLILNL